MSRTRAKEATKTRVPFVPESGPWVQVWCDQRQGAAFHRRVYYTRDGTAPKKKNSENCRPTGQTPFHRRVYCTREGSTSKKNFMEEDSLPPDLAMIELLFMEEDRLPPDLASVGSICSQRAIGARRTGASA